LGAEVWAQWNELRHAAAVIGTVLCTSICLRSWTRTLLMSTSMLYELIEWGTSVVFGGDLGQAYLGTQDDEWDAHKDMALASLGALIAMGITAALNWRLQRDFAREWVESLRLKHKAPLGEDAMKRMARKSK
jgi:putative membrane protein